MGQTEGKPRTPGSEGPTVSEQQSATPQAEEPETDQLDFVVDRVSLVERTLAELRRKSPGEAIPILIRQLTGNLLPALRLGFQELQIRDSEVWEELGMLQGEIGSGTEQLWEGSSLDELRELLGDAIQICAYVLHTRGQQSKGNATPSALPNGVDVGKVKNGLEQLMANLTQLLMPGDSCLSEFLLSDGEPDEAEEPCLIDSRSDQ